MAEQLAACARQLFEGAAGGDEQRAANAWLMGFQRRDEAWTAALQLLQNPPRDEATGCALPAPELVAVQILRLKIQQEWAGMAVERRLSVRNALLQLLGNACIDDQRATLSPVSFRVACTAVANIVVHSYKDWPTWKADVRQLMDAGFAANSPRGAVMLMEVLGAIPVQIVLVSREWEEAECRSAVAAFQLECEQVVAAVQSTLTSVPETQLCALRCLENWVVGAIPAHENFGVNAVHLLESQLMDSLFVATTTPQEDFAQVASGILHDVLAFTPSLLSDERLVQAIRHAGKLLVSTGNLLQSAESMSNSEVMTNETHTTICRGLSQVACALAMNHARILFDVNTRSGQEQNHVDTRRFQTQFLEFLLACSSHKDAEVVLPTLEVWFFFLDERTAQMELSWQMLVPSAREHAFSVLSRLVNALINHCKYPAWFIDSAQITSDEPEIEAVNNLRREIADTLLSLFSKWPGVQGEPNGDYLSCVEGMTQILLQTSDIGLMNAVLHLLDSMIELFDIESSDSESDEEDQGVPQTASEGIQILQSVLNNSHCLPTHPLVLEGLTRYLRSLSATLVLPGQTILHVSLTISRGLEYAPSFSVALQSLVHSSYSITKHTLIEDRMPLLQALLRAGKAIPDGVTETARGDLLEVTFLLADGISDSDFGSFCTTTLSDLTEQTQSGTENDACSAIYLLGRAISGVQNVANNRTLISQVWPLVDAALHRHQGAPACRVCGPRFFLDTLELLDETMLNGLQSRMLELLIRWYPQDLAPDILRCCAKIIHKNEGNDEFNGVAQHIISTLLLAFRRKLHDEPLHEPVSARHAMKQFLQSSQHAELLAPEIEQFLSLCRQALRSFPQAIASSPGAGQLSLYWSCLQLATALIELDHQVQEICDAACDFVLEAVGSRAGPCLAELDAFTVPIVRSAFEFLHPSRATHYRPRSVWEFLFQLLHSPRIPSGSRAKFHAAVAVVATTDLALQPLFRPDELLELSEELVRRTSRHRFRQFMTHIAAQVACGGQEE